MAAAANSVVAPAFVAAYSTVAVVATEGSTVVDSIDFALSDPAEFADSATAGDSIDSVVDSNAFVRFDPKLFADSATADVPIDFVAGSDADSTVAGSAEVPNFAYSIADSNFGRLIEADPKRRFDFD